MAGNYPAGVSDNDPYFDMPSVDGYEEDDESYEEWKWRVSHVCDACRFGNHAACQVAVDPRYPLDICKCDRCR